MRAISIKGQKFHKLLALDEYKSINLRVHWKFLCDCGEVCFKNKYAVQRGKTKSCGCDTRILKRQNRSINITNQKYGKLTALEYIETRNGGSEYWKFLCECGIIKIIHKGSVIYGNTNSCGCILKEYTKEMGRSNKMPEGVAAFNRLILLYKNGAKKRNMSYNLSDEQFRELSSKECYYCGESPNKIIKTHSDTGIYVYNGIDRMDNLIGYEIENCYSCCTQCNYSKGDITFEQFKHWITLTYKNLKKRNLINE